MKNLVFLILFLTMLFLGAVSAEAANRYVRAGASGSADGSDWTNAYAKLPTTLTRGDTYYVADGNYPGQQFTAATSGTSVITIKKATIADHGTDTGWQNAYGDGQATFSGMLDFRTSYWIIDGVTGGGVVNNWNQNFGFKIIETNDSNAVIRIGYTSTANNITIRHVDMQGKGSVGLQGGSYGNDGLAVYGASNVTLSYFWMHGIGRCPFFISPRNLIVEHGWVQSFYGSSDVHSEVASIWSFAGNIGDTTFRYNLFTDIQSTGGLMWDSSRNASAVLAIYGNVFYHAPGASWSAANGLIGGWTCCPALNIRVYNNTFIDTGSGGQALSSFPPATTTNEAKNNLFYSVRNVGGGSAWTSVTHNHFLSSNTLGTNTSTGSGNPFVDAPNLNFSLMVATPAGTTLPAPYNTDMYGTVRGADGVWDRGAVEYETGGNLTTPASPTNLRVQ